MTTTQPMVIHSAVEGPLDEAVLQRLITHVGAVSGPVYGKQGKGRLVQRLNAYNEAARHYPWTVLIDLDNDLDCAPAFCAAHLPAPAAYMCFRVAVHEVEAWLLADDERLASFLSVAVSKIPRRPDEEGDPKHTMVELGKASRKRDIQLDLVPRPASGRQVGPAYVSRLIEFVSDREHGWRPDVAARASDSLNRCMRCLRRLTGART